MRFEKLSSSLAALASVTCTVASAEPPQIDVRADRQVEAVVLGGAAFPRWSAGSELTVRRPQVLGGQSPIGQAAPSAVAPSDCASQTTQWDATADHSCNQKPDAALYGSSVFAGGTTTSTGLRPGVPIDHLLGYRWDGGAGGFVEIPFQVDERFVRYLSNNQSGFAFYSGVDQHTTYAFDKENFRFVENGRPDEPGYAKPYDPLCDSRPRADGVVAEPDPIGGLDDDDELVFMAADAGAQAPPGAALPRGIAEAVEVRLVDPLDPSAKRYAYVMRAAEGGPRPSFDASNGYVRYAPDPDADMFVYSQSSYSSYGNAPKGPYCDPATGRVVRDASGQPLIAQRRPRDTAWIRTPRYEFRYAGRWLMTEIHVSPDDQGLAATADYGPDLIDRWKARAFQQDPSSKTPCCGYEEEDTNWGGSSITLGVKVGPVRAIRETWGADSGTNVVRRETFYADSVNYAYYLRVHPIPPLDGIYTQWDYNAGRITKYYNPMVPKGVDVDGRDDKVFGNVDDPCNPLYQTLYGPTYRQIPGLCPQNPLFGQSFPYHQSVALFDPTYSFVNATLQWEQAAGPWGTFVTRWMINQVTPGAAQGILAVPYYRDDSCFDDGTGSDPGPRVRLRSPNEIRTDAAGTARRCWTPADGIPNADQVNPGEWAPGQPWPRGDLRFLQGDIGTHGLHLLFVVESDNASTTVPLTEIDSQQWQVILPGEQDGEVGERYGRELEKPLAAVATPRTDLR